MRTIVYRYDDKLAKVKVKFDNKVILDVLYEVYKGGRWFCIQTEDAEEKDFMCTYYILQQK